MYEVKQNIDLPPAFPRDMKEKGRHMFINNYHNDPKLTERKVWESRADTDQIAPRGA